MIKVRIIFTKCVQDGETHYSQKWWTADIPVPPSMERKFEQDKDIVGCEIVKTVDNEREKTGGAE